VHARLLLLVLVPALVSGLLVVGAQAQSLSDIQSRLADARSERIELEGRVAEAIAEIEELEGLIAELEAERQDLDDEVSGLRRDLDELVELVEFRVRETFKHGSNLDPIAVFLGSDDPDAALSRAQAVARVVSGDQARSEALVAARDRLVAAELRLAESAQELEEAKGRQAEVVAQLKVDFERVQALEQELTAEEREERERLARIERERKERERKERERREQAERAAAERRANASRPAASSPSSSPRSSARAATNSGGMACPLDQPRHFIDSWGHARSGGRAHRGTDIMGPRGIPVRAITSGTWQIQRSGPSAGHWGILRGDNGNHYWYMHLDSHTVGNGARVSAGQQVGTNGSTGNASAGAEHVHFELHPGGGSAINPYPLLRSVCG
jgi:peptidoglycan LD-endopeptidase LytH